MAEGYELHYLDQYPGDCCPEGQCRLSIIAASLPLNPTLEDVEAAVQKASEYDPDNAVKISFSSSMMVISQGFSGLVHWGPCQMWVRSGENPVRGSIFDLQCSGHKAGDTHNGAHSNGACTPEVNLSEFARV